MKASYSLRERIKKTSHSPSEDSPPRTAWEKQNQAVAQIRKRDLNTWYYACSICPRILLSKQKRKLHEIRVHGKYPRIPQQHNHIHAVVTEAKPRNILKPVAQAHPGPVSLTKSRNMCNKPVSQPKRRGPGAPTKALNFCKPVSQPHRPAGPEAPAKPRNILKPIVQSHRPGPSGPTKPPTIMIPESPRPGPGPGPGDFSCQHCQSQFTSPWNLKVHLQTIHDNVRPFPCSVCGNRFKQRIHLLGHFISTHSKIKAFRCDLCSFGFTKKWNLFDHARKHHHATEADLNRLKLRYSKRRVSTEKDD